MDVYTLMKQLIEYLIQGAAVAAAAIIIPRRALPFDEVLTLALTAAATLLVMDRVKGLETVSSGIRSGMGFGLGANIVGFPRI